LVALKILAPEKEQDAQFAARFTREAQALARLNHPNIIGVHDSGEAEGLYYLVMEFVDGVSLRHLIRSHKLTPEEALAIVPKICEALQYAHDRGVVHRDIKPENILLDAAGNLKIADFGIAKILGTDRAQPAITLATHVIGTPHYMAPEQIEKPHLVDHRADIYSLGVVFYEMLTGELPLGQFQPPSSKAALDVRLDEVVLGALAKEPDRRYQHASEVKTDVETIAATPASAETTTAHQEPVGGLPPVLPESEFQVTSALVGPSALEERPEGDQPRKRARRTAAIAGLLITFLLLGLVAFLGIVWFWKGTPATLLVGTKPSQPVAPDLTPAELNPPPLPPLPAIFISDLPPLRFVSGYGQSGINQSVEGNPLTVGGQTYEHGLGTHANGEAIFTIPVGARRFVSVVGLDDEVSNDEWGRGSVIFEVYGEADEPGKAPVLLGKSPVLSPKTIRFWAFDLELESRLTRIDLVVSDAGDDNECDHADWVNTGFLK
jgi:serine/threonine protein kinase